MFASVYKTTAVGAGVPDGPFVPATYAFATIIQLGDGAVFESKSAILAQKDAFGICHPPSPNCIINSPQVKVFTPINYNLGYRGTILPLF